MNLFLIIALLTSAVLLLFAALHWNRQGTLNFLVRVALLVCAVADITLGARLIP